MTISTNDLSNSQTNERQAEKTVSNSEYKTVGNPFVNDPRMTARGVDVFYGDKQALHDVSMSIPKNQVTAFIGPSGCGKSTLLRCINRMNDLVDG